MKAWVFEIDRLEVRLQQAYEAERLQPRLDVRKA